MESRQQTSYPQKSLHRIVSAFFVSMISVDATVVYIVTCLQLSLPLPNEISGSQVPAHILIHNRYAQTPNVQTSSKCTAVLALRYCSPTDMIINVHFHFHTYPCLCIQHIDVLVVPTADVPTIDYTEPVVHLGEGEVADRWQGYSTNTWLTPPPCSENEWTLQIRQQSEGDMQAYQTTLYVLSTRFYLWFC